MYDLFKLYSKRNSLQDTVHLGAYCSHEGLPSKELHGLTWFHIPQNGSQVLRPTFPTAQVLGVITAGAWGSDRPQKRGYEDDSGRVGQLEVFRIRVQRSKCLSKSAMNTDPPTLEKRGQRRILALALTSENPPFCGF